MREVYAKLAQLEYEKFWRSTTKSRWLITTQGWSVICYPQMGSAGKDGNYVYPDSFPLAAAKNAGCKILK